MSNNSAFAGNEVGAIPGSFAVSPTGAATYSIPIQLPPGVAGLAPPLALVYNSQMGNSLAGYGWMLSGLSVLTVCNKTWAQDGVNQGVSFAGTSPDTNDYCLDGAKLVPTSAGANTYRKERDDFSQITAESAGGAGPTTTAGPQWFEVQTADGLTYEYGKTADSEIVAAGPGIKSGVTMARAWALDQIYDKYGNSVSFSYSQDTTNGDFWPTQITYTNHGSTAGPHSIVFTYTSLASVNPGLVWTSYLAGALISQTQRLAKIDVDYNGSPTFTYTLGYETTLTDSNGHTGTERSRLTSVNECAGNTCYPQTTISWQSGVSGWGGAVSTGGGPTDKTYAPYMYLMDISGDGRPDIVFPDNSPGQNIDWWVMRADPSQPGGFDAPVDTKVNIGVSYSSDMPIDFYGDGRQELLDPGYNGDWWILDLNCALNKGTNCYTDTGTPAVGETEVVDYNGDGLEDLVYTTSTGTYWLQNTGGHFASPVQISAAIIPGGQINHQLSPGAPDFNGDGRGDRVGITTFTQQCNPDSCPPGGPQSFYTLHVNVASGGVNGYTPAGTVGPTTNALDNPIPVDFNGDGLADILVAETGGSSPTGWNWQAYASTGTSLSQESYDGEYDPATATMLTVSDYSGNGRQSLLVPMSNGDWGVIGEAGGVLTGPTDTKAPFPASGSYCAGTLRSGDVNGDGLDDLVWGQPNGSGGCTWYVSQHTGPYPDLVTGIDDGFNRNLISAIHYAPLTDSSVYTKGTVSTYPTNDIEYPVYVVQNYTAADGVGGSYAVDFTYADAKEDVSGRGFLGFATVTRTDTRNKAVTATNYNQLFPLTGTVASQSFTVGGNLERSIANHYTSVSTLSGAQYVYASITSVSDSEIGAGSPYRTVSTTTTPTLSSSGVITSEAVVTSTTPATVSSTTTTHYQTDTGNWCLDLPASVTVENTGVNSNNGLDHGDITRTVTYTPDTSHCRLTGKSVSVTDTGASNTVSETLATAYGYDPGDGNLTTQTVTATTNGTTASYQTIYGYDPTNTFVAKVTNPLNQISTATWDPTLGMELSSTDPNGITTQFGYDAFGLKTSETLGDGTSISWSYCLPANGCSVSGGAYSMTATHYSASSVAGKTGTTVYDSFGRPVLQSTYVVGGAETHVATAYDALGRVASVSTPYESSASTYTYTTYDAFSRPSAVYTPAAANNPACSVVYQNETACETSYSYNGLTTSVTDPKGNVTTKTVDALGEVTAVTNGYGSATSATTLYGYDPFGDLAQTTDAKKNVTSMHYDSLGRKLSMNDPDMGIWNYTYDPRGLLTSQTDPKSQQITMQYDALGRMTSRTEPLASGGSGTDTWIYDGPNGVPTAPDIGKLVEVEGADGYIKQYQYDSAGRPQETDVTINGTTYATNTAYDSFGRVASVTYPSTPVPLADDPPVANAGASQAGIVGQTFTLDGSGSYDPDNGPQPLTYKWVQTSGPVDTSADGATTADVSFSTATAGTYDFTLTVSDGELTDSAATTVTVNPTQVTGLSASAVDPNTGDFTLSWSPAAGATSYSLEQSENGGSYSLLSQTYSGTSAAFTGYGNGSYSFAVQGCGNNACGAFSSAVSVSVLRTPATPSAPTVSPNPSSNGSYTVSWSGESGASSYALYSSTNGSTYTSTNVGSATSQSETQSSSGTYYYKVAACNASGCSATSGATTETVAFPVPGAPVLSPSSQTIPSGGTASVSWQPQGPAATSYTLQGKAASGSWSTVYTGTATSFSQSLTGGVAGLHYYQVEACNGYGCSAWSNTVSVTIQSNSCRTCSRLNAMPAAPGGSTPAPTTPAPGSATSVPPASGGLSMSAPAANAPGTKVQLASASSSVVLKHAIGPSPTAQLAQLRREALHIKAERIAEQPAHAAPAPQPLYAAEVETSAGLMSAQQAVALGLLNPHRLAEHTERTTTGTSRYQVNYIYDAHGNLTEVVDAADANRIYWQATAGNAFGQVTTELLGNGVINGYGFDPNTGELTTLQSGPGGNPTLADWNYQWDQDGNLSQRNDKNANLTEKFTYDSLNRLTEADVSGASTSSQSFSYDAVGDFTFRTGVGTYNYKPSPQPPMQIASITAPNGTTRSFSYDPDGNTLSDGIHSYTWDALNRATAIQDTVTGGSEQIAYTPDGARYLETTTQGSTSSTLTEVTPLFEVEATASYIYYRETIVGGTGPVAIRTIRNDGILTTRYLSGDHLGSVSLITNEIGGEVEAMSYGPFGERRDPNTWQPYSTRPDLTDITDKGYTGQQMLDAVGLIHMNGRVYDPSLGRMISADPTVPDPLDSQSFNRYAYVYNNPLNSTDPSGYSINCETGEKQDDGNGNTCTGSHIPGVDTGTSDGAFTGGGFISGGESSSNQSTYVCYNGICQTGVLLADIQLGEIYVFAYPTLPTLTYFEAYPLNPFDDVFFWLPPGGNSGASNASSVPMPYRPTNAHDALTALICSEACGQYKNPRALAAAGYVPVNRARSGIPYFSKTIVGNIYEKGQFAGVGGKQWNLVANPAALIGPNAAAVSAASLTATGILNGSIPDPTGGALWLWTHGVPYPSWLNTDLLNGSVVDDGVFGANDFFSPGN